MILITNINSKNYFGFSHAKYIENDPVKYDITANQITFTENQSTHFHDDVEILFVLDGEAKLIVNSEANLISSGDLIMLAPYHVHSINITSSNLKVYQCKVSLGLLLFSSLSRVVEKHISYSLAYGNVVAKFTGKEKKAITENFIEMLDELESDNTLNTMVALSIVIKIILLFSRKIVKGISDNTIPEHSLTWKLLEYMNSNFCNDISAKSLAAKFSLTPLKVNNYFYLLTGENFSENLHRTRIRHACSMLQFDQLSSSYIGKYVGYKNTSSFFRKFKEIKNMTPDEYRKEHTHPDNTYRNLNTSWKIILYLYEHYSEPLNEKSISQALFLSPETIRTELLSNFDASLAELLVQIRIQYARSFLQVLDAPVLKIAYLTGFSSVRTFNRCFKNMMRCTPVEYRKRMVELRSEG